MRHSHTFPLDRDADTYIIMQDYGRDADGRELGLAWEETSPEDATYDGCIKRLKEYASYPHIPVIKAILCFNVVEGWSRDVTLEMLTVSGFIDRDPDEDFVPDRFDRDASRADWQRDQRLEGVS